MLGAHCYPLNGNDGPTELSVTFLPDVPVKEPRKIETTAASPFG